MRPITVTQYKEKPIGPAREITCERCGEIFYTRKSGKPKYCGNCKVIVFEESAKRYNRKAKRRRRLQRQGVM